MSGMKDTQPALALERVTKRYGAVTALREVSFSIPAGQTVGLLGRNGAGKTTALNLMTGYFPPTEGVVRVAGQDLAEEPRACKRRIGFLPDRPPLYDEMTVAEYLRFVCDLREVAPRARAAHVEESLEKCGLTEVRERLLGQLSRGYRQRAGIAQALCGSPDILMLDEPTVGLDPRQTVEMRTLIRQLGRERTVIFSSHLLSEVQELCARVLILQEGRLAGDVSLEAGGEAGRRLRLTVAEGSPRVLSALRQVPGVARVERQRGTEAGGAELLLEMAGDRADREIRDQVFRTLAALDVPIRAMGEEQEGLEALFLRLTADEEG